jgi:hypothetical protein
MMRIAGRFLMIGRWLVFGVIAIGATRADGQLLNFPVQPDRPAQFEIMNDPEAPLRIAHAYVDEMPNGRKALKYSVLNSGSKHIRSASIVVHYGEGNIQGQTGFFTSMPPGTAHDGVVYLDELIAPDLRGAQIAADYVLHTDGSTWGKNESGERDVNVGHETGQRDAVRSVRSAVGDRRALAKLLLRSEADRVIKAYCTAANPKLCEGYRFGYGLATGTLRIALQHRKMEGLLEKLAEIERSFETN